MAQAVVIRHATYTQDHFTLLQTWYLIQLNIPTRTALFSSPSGLLIIVAAREETFSSLPKVNEDKFIDSSHRKSGSDGGLLQ